MTRAIIIDDEQHCIDRLSDLVNTYHYASVAICGTGRSVEEGINVITALQPDRIFLDVQLHDKTGFDLLRALPKSDYGIIFTTAYEKYAIQAIKFSAVDYLLKPIDKNDLNAALIKSANEISKKATSAKLDVLLQNTELKNKIPKKITVPTISGFEFLEVADIIRCKSDINYTTIYSLNKQKLVVAKTLKEFEELLADYNFFRIHNSDLINLAYIKSYNKGKGGSVLLTDGTEIEVSTRRKDDFLKRLKMI